MASEGTIDTEAENLQILLNLLHEDARRLRVEYPFYDLELLSYDPRRGRLRSFVTPDALADASNQHRPSDPDLADELPSWQDVQNACLCSGIVDYDNHEEARQAFEEAWEAARRPHGMPTYIAFDTNVFYNRVATRRIEGDFLGENAHRVPFIVSEAVREELDRQANEKYSSNEVDQLRRTLDVEDLVGALTNRRDKQARIATDALGEVNYLTHRLRAAETTAAKLPGGEENDRVIAQSYRDYGQEHYGRIVLITADSGMQTNASTKGLETIFLETPRMEEPPSGELDERTLCNLVHDLAVRFQFLRFPRTGITIWGDWSGKTPQDWMDDVVRIEHTGSKVAGKLAEGLEAVKGVKAGLENR